MVRKITRQLQSVNLRLMSMKWHFKKNFNYSFQIEQVENHCWEGRLNRAVSRRDFRSTRAILLAEVFVIPREINYKRVIDCAARYSSSLCTRLNVDDLFIVPLLSPASTHFSC